MGKLKDAAIGGKSNGKAKPPTKAEPTPPVPREPVRFTYALAAYTAECRHAGWYIAKTTPTFTGEKMHWIGPFETIETACLAIARRLATEIADRHTRAIETHKIAPTDPLYGLKETTRLSKDDDAGDGSLA